MKHFYIAVACTKDGGIGKDGKIPWYLQPDLRYFQKITSATFNASKQNAVIMGRNTWNSLPKRPLKGRRNIVLTTSKDVEPIIAEGGEVYRSLDDALTHLGNDENVEKMFVIGGGKLYEEAIDHPLCKCVFATIIENDNDYKCDTFFPIKKMRSDQFYICGSTLGMYYKDIRFSYIRYCRKN